MKKKYALITGASRGIGKETARHLAANGYFVFINCRKSIHELRETYAQIRAESGDCCEMVVGDIGNPADVKNMFAVIRSHCQALDVLVNNAAISHIGLMTDMSDDDWDQIIRTNLSAVFYLCREAVPAMVSQKSGKIINISSMWGTYGASCEVAYSAAKAGLNGFTKALAKELAPSNIQVNAIACGVIDTEMNRQLDDVERAALRGEIPAGRFGTAKETAALVGDLAAGHAYMTGQIIGLDGGF